MDFVKYNHDYLIKEKSYFRTSYIIKLIFGSGIICSSATCISLYLVQAGYQSKKYVYNFSKGSFLLNLSILTLNELYYIMFVHFKVYENFCITYFLSGMTVYSKFVDILVKKQKINYFEAKFYAKKNILYLISIWITFELYLKVKKNNIAYDELDIIDIVNFYYKKKNIIPDFEDSIKLRQEIMNIVATEKRKNKYSLTKFNSKKKNDAMDNFMKMNGKANIDIVDFVIFYLYLCVKEKEIEEKSTYKV